MPSYVGLQPNFTIYDTSDARQTIKRVIEAREINTLNYSPDGWPRRSARPRTS